MLVYIFKAILITSLIGTAATLLLTIMRPITRKTFSSSWHYYMWLVVLVSMILPIRISIPEQTQAMPDSKMVGVAQNETIIYNPTQMDEQNTLAVAGEEEHASSKIDTISEYAQSKVYVLAFIWLAGMFLTFAYKIIGYVLFLFSLRRSSSIISCPELLKYTDKPITTRVSEEISSPLMIGVFRPTLLLPAIEMKPEQLNNVLAHETTHFIRKDIIYKWFISIVKCIHWFNPIVYYISKQAEIECEISCDLAVVKDMSEEQETNYIDTILTLLGASRRKKVALTTGMTSDKKTLKRRFTMIKNKVKFSRKTVIISIVLALVVLCGTVLAGGLINTWKNKLILSGGLQYKKFSSGYFNMGIIIFSKGVNAIVGENKTFARAVTTALLRYCKKDWGKVSRDTKKQNKENLSHPEDLYLFGVYKTRKGDIWIVTNRATENPGENVTMVLFPDEY